MDTRQLEYFVAVAEELSFSRAAVRTFAAQSTVSAGIRSLERDLDSTLFQRSSQAVTLTTAGMALLPEARAALESMDRVRSSVASTAAEIRGRLRIGTFISLDALELPRTLGAYHRRHPLVDVRLFASATGSTGLVDDLRRGRADVVFSGLPPQDVSGFRVVELARSSFVALLPEGDERLERTEIELADLIDGRWIDSPAGYASRVMVDRLFASRGLERVLSAEVADAREIPRLVAAGLGYAVIPQLIYQPAPGARAVPISARGLEMVIRVISRADPTPAASAFMDLITT